MEMPVSDTGMPVLPSPVEGGSAQTSSVGVGDPRADSNAVVQARDAGKTIVDTIKVSLAAQSTAFAQPVQALCTCAKQFRS